MLSESGSLPILAHNGVTIVQGNASQSEEKQEKKSAARKTGLSIARAAPLGSQHTHTHRHNTREKRFMQRARMHAAGENFSSRKGFLLFYDCWIYGHRRKQPDATFDDSAWRELLKCFGVRFVCGCHE